MEAKQKYYDLDDTVQSEGCLLVLVLNSHKGDTEVDQCSIKYSTDDTQIKLTDMSQRAV